jgi:hypothetical protein
MSEVPVRRAKEPAGSLEVRLTDAISGRSLDPGQALMWRRSVPLAPDFELRQGDRIFGEMESASIYEMDATGECLGRSLELRMESSLLRGIRVETRCG